MKRAIIPVGVIATLSLLIVANSCQNFSVSWSKTNDGYAFTPPKLKVYIESSGSMDGYLCAGSEFKDAIYSYTSALNSFSDTLELSYINSEIVPYTGELKTFIRDLTVAQFRQIKGDKTNSDIADMFEKMLAAQDESSVTLFVSDCILDVPQGNAADYLVNRQIDIRNAFVKKLNENSSLGVEVFRLESKFNGKYYQANGGVLLTDESRPYYIWIMGNKNVLAYLNRKVPFSEIKHGYKNYFAFSSYTDVPFELMNRFNQVKIPCVEKTAIGGVYTIKIKADLSTTLQEGGMLTDVSRYSVQNSQVSISSIEPLEGKDAYTHLLTLQIDENIKSCAEFIKYVSPPMPSWATMFNDDKGYDIKANMEKTTGILNIITGVSDAYKDRRELAGIKFVIHN